MAADNRWALHISDVAHVWPFILLFEAVGVALLLPLGLALLRRPLPTLLYPFLLAIAGSAIGALLMVPISIGGVGLPTLPMACGALSALVWLAFNRAPIRC